VEPGITFADFFLVSKVSYSKAWVKFMLDMVVELQTCTGSS